MAEKITSPDPLEEYPMWATVRPELHPLMLAGLLLDDTARLQRTTMTKRMAKYGVTFKQWYALSHINRKNGMTQTEIGFLLNITKGACTTLMDRLSNGGWIKRKQCTSDRRNYLIFITNKGKDLLSKEIEMLAVMYAEVFQDISPEHMETLIMCLSKSSRRFESILERGE